MTSAVRVGHADVISISADLGDAPPVGRVQHYFEIIGDLFEYGVAVDHIVRQDADHDFEALLNLLTRRLALLDPSDPMIAEVNARMILVFTTARGTREALRVTRISMSSPIELNLTEIAGSVMGQVGIGLFLLDRLVRLVMRYQRHRVALDRERYSLYRDRIRDIDPEVANQIASDAITEFEAEVLNQAAFAASKQEERSLKVEAVRAVGLIGTQVASKLARYPLIGIGDNDTPRAS